MYNQNLWTPHNSGHNSVDFKNDFDSAIFKEFGPHSNSKCFSGEKRSEYIEKLLLADITRELPKQLRGFCIGDVNNYWDQAEWRFKTKTVDKVHLWTKKTFSSSAKNLGIIRRIIVLEEFFDLIKSHHERPNKDGYNGQKKLFNLIKNRYACLPRDAVDKYITMWRKATSQTSPSDNGNATSLDLDRDGLKEQKSRSNTMRAERTIADNKLSKATTAAITIPTSDIFTEDDRRKKNSIDTASPSYTDPLYKFSGISMVYQPQASSDLKSTHSPLLNIKYQIDNGDNKLLPLMTETTFNNSILKQDCDSSNQGSSKENSFENEDLIPNKRIKLEEGDSETNTDNDDALDDNSSHINGDASLKVNGMKRPSDIDMAYNIFVRRLIDTTLDRTITFCEQPKHTILSLESICADAFPTFDKSRHRIKIRGYLKACRRNSKKHNGKISMKDTPSHMCSEKAYSIANEALLKIDKDLERLKVVRPGDSEVNQLSICKPGDTEGSKNDAKCSEYMDLVMSSSNLELAFPLAANSAWSNNEHFSSVLANFLPSLYGMIPLPPLLTPNISGVSTEIVSPPPAHSNQYLNSLPGTLFSVMDGCSHYASTSHLLDKMLHTNSIDPDFGMELIVNRSASQEAINCMRVTARYLLSRSVMMESYLIKESARFTNIPPDDNN